MVFRLGEQVGKINWTPWVPSFRYQEAKKSLYDRMIYDELMRKQDFDLLTPDRMYQELVRAMTNAGRKLMEKKPRHQGGRMNVKLKRLKHDLINQKSLNGKQSQSYQKAAEVIVLSNLVICHVVYLSGCLYV